MWGQQLLAIISQNNPNIRFLLFSCSSSAGLVPTIWRFPQAVSSDFKFAVVSSLAPTHAFEDLRCDSKR